MEFMTKAQKIISEREERCDGNSLQYKTRNFLISLSDHVPISLCDVQAKKFRRDFEKYRNDLCQYLFELFDKQVFGEKLGKKTEVKWNNRLTATAGYTDLDYRQCVRCSRKTRYSKIELSIKVLDTAERLRDTLIHEMCHAAVWNISKLDEHHGPIWKSWTKKSRIALKGIPPIDIYHDYEVRTKYIYQCAICRYRVGRHSKSLDTRIDRCERCHGKLLLKNNNR